MFVILLIVFLLFCEGLLNLCDCCNFLFRLLGGRPCFGY
ncbi:hypothetical protein KC19_11G020200 [Ceratodon purpureus]|uniref:Uncharacterized protein n=1 Tax=Ceratodon purpureus TaxID=3225 RepID=A0A8T0GFR9_CERPU|nr:hypothetical protein KC19_11G020200 [Ceratodon purpureus]